MSELFWCRIHDHAVEIPEGAIQIETKTKTYRCFKFPDGSLHDCRKPTNTKTEAGHIRLHVKKQLKKPGCKWCYPESIPQPEPPQEETVSAVDPEAQEHLMGIGTTELKEQIHQQEFQDQSELLRQTLTEMLAKDKKELVESGNIMLAAFRRNRNV